MKANELRLGNWISAEPYGEFKIIGMTSFEDKTTLFKDLNYYPESTKIENAKPIPLTEDWLLKFGFNKFPNQKRYDRDDFWSCNLRYGNEWHFEDLEMFIRYVHELQNLFFSVE